ncbi:MAG: Gamma-glutamyl phosphate reductase [Candidatus Omnitrophica bacterium]|nr:Gamma-glutamyl phosphate reductase [Candidatus Omnitrophota bacterium]
MSSARTLAAKARRSATALAEASTELKNKALLAMADALEGAVDPVLRANALDVAGARRAGLSPSLIGRLQLDAGKVRRIAGSIRSIAALPDPVGRVLLERERPNGLKIRKIGVPIGVILIIYESRPNVTADCMALCLKSGNSVILKGGSESARSNRAIHGVLRRAAAKAGLPADAFGLITAGGRAAVAQLLKMNDLIDLVIPRGGEGLIRSVAAASRIPVIKHYKGVCHVYVAPGADPDKARRIAVNAKTHNPGVCNAMETLLVDRSVAGRLLPLIATDLAGKGVELRGDAEARRLVPSMKQARESDWPAEYLDLVLAVRVVDGMEAAIAHIRKYGSAHSDAIVTEDAAEAREFARRVDSACVFLNCSTRFNDGGEFGMGAEMGISTDKLHARGPMGLEELTSYKYVVTGDGQVRS